MLIVTRIVTQDKMINCSFPHLDKWMSSQQNNYTKLTREKCKTSQELLIKKQTWVLHHLQFVMPFIHQVRTPPKTSSLAAKDDDTSTEDNTKTDIGDPSDTKFLSHQKKRKYPAKELRGQNMPRSKTQMF